MRDAHALGVNRPGTCLNSAVRQGPRGRLSHDEHAGLAVCGFETAALGLNSRRAETGPQGEREGRPTFRTAGHAVARAAVLLPSTIREPVRVLVDL